MSSDLKTSQEKPNILRPLNEKETIQFLDYYKELLLNSIKQKPGEEKNDELYEKIKKLSYVHNKIDPKCCLKISKRLVRIEYPGNVKNVDKAIKTLGGIENIELNVADQRKRLELRFHPDNQFNKSIVGDKDFKPGILIKVKPKKKPGDPGCSKAEDVVEDGEMYDYEIIGISVINYTFNRLCDFQYLPLVAGENENKNSKTEYIYEKIFPKHIPDVEWFGNEEFKNMEAFLLPVRFSHYDNSNVKLNFDNIIEKVDDDVDQSVSKSVVQRRKKICRIFGKKQQLSYFVDFKDKEVPTKPSEATLKFLLHRSSDDIARVKQLFEERPIWTKSAILYNTGLRLERSKHVLPMVAYFFVNGPWRTCWVKFGYDPRNDPQARIYQTLDYRIRTQDSVQLKVNTKRTYASKCTLTLGPNNSKKISLKDDISIKPKGDLDEKCYILRPYSIPPARQLSYQLCDLLLPEIQDKLSRSPYERVCDPKHGWLSKTFMTECREIVNSYVLQAVKTELLKDNKEMEEKQSKSEELRKAKDKGQAMDYCQQMLSNIKKGIYKNVKLNLSGPVRDVDLDNLGDDVEMVCLSDDDDELTVGDVIQNTIPERMNNEDEEDNEDVEDDASDYSDDPEIDMEVVEEINKLIKDTKS